MEANIIKTEWEKELEARIMEKEVRIKELESRIMDKEVRIQELEERLKVKEACIKDLEPTILELDNQLAAAKGSLKNLLISVQATAHDLLDEAENGTVFNPGSQQVYAIMLVGVDYCARYVLRKHYKLSDEIRTRLVQAMEHACDEIDNQRYKLEGVHWDGVEF